MGLKNIFVTETPRIIKKSISKYFLPLRWLYKTVTSSKENAPVVLSNKNKLTPKMKVMLVDDSDSVRDMLSSVLVKSGYEVIVEQNGTDALRDLSSFSPDLVLMDIEMPKMDGYEVVKKIRQNEEFRSTPVVMLTSKEQTTINSDKLYGLRVIREDDNTSILETIHDISLSFKT